MSFKYKYRLNHLLSLLPDGIYPENIIAHLEIAHQIYPQEFSRDRYIEMNAPDEIPPDRLVKYSQVFQVRMEELKNELRPSEREAIRP